MMQRSKRYFKILALLVVPYLVYLYMQISNGKQNVFAQVQNQQDPIWLDTLNGMLQTRLRELKGQKEDLLISSTITTKVTTTKVTTAKVTTAKVTTAKTTTSSIKPTTTSTKKSSVSILKPKIISYDQKETKSKPIPLVPKVEFEEIIEVHNRETLEKNKQVEPQLEAEKSKLPKPGMAIIGTQNRITPQVTKNLQVYVRSYSQHYERRHAFREHYKMWQSKITDKILPAKYIFVMDSGGDFVNKTMKESELYKDIYLTTFSLTLDSYENDSKLFLKSLKLAGNLSLGNETAMHGFNSDNTSVNLFLRDTDVVNYNTIRNSFNDIALSEGQTTGMLTFGVIKRRSRSTKYADKKIAIRADLSKKYWTRIAQEITRPGYAGLSSESKISKITGDARVAASIKEIWSNRRPEVILTLPYDSPKYEMVQDKMLEWTLDHKPPYLMTDILPDIYLKDRKEELNIRLLVIPKCPSVNILSLVKTARHNTRLRTLTRINYSGVLQRNKLHQYPNLRFLIGKAPPGENPTIEKLIEAEINQHQDIVIGDFLDTYDNLPLKTMTGYEYLNSECPADVKWVMFHDDDVFMDLERAVKYFAKPNAEELNCFGFLGSKFRPHRFGKYHVETEQWASGHYFPQFCSGPCNGLSRDSTRKLYETARKTDMCGFRLEDVYFLGIIRQKAELNNLHFEQGICQHVASENHIAGRYRMYLKAGHKTDEEIKVIMAGP